MSGHLCVKWNNHSSAFLKNIKRIQRKERFCDATLVCQGRYFPVHRVVLSTCSDYFDEIFEQIQCPHPYIVFKDIEPNEMELLLNYMYDGAVNVIQDSLPALIKAAEALRIKGLAVPDDEHAIKDTTSFEKKRSTAGSSRDSRRRTEEKSNNYSNSSEDVFTSMTNTNEAKIIKKPLELSDYEESVLPVDDSVTSATNNSQLIDRNENKDYSMNFAEEDSLQVNINTESDLPLAESFEEEAKIIIEPLELSDYEESVLPDDDSVTSATNNSQLIDRNENKDYSMNFAEEDCLKVNINTESDLPLAESFEEENNVESRRQDWMSPQRLETEKLYSIEPVMTDSRIELFICSECDYKTDILGDFNLHKDTHSSIQTRKCPDCEFRADTKQKLHKHLLTHSVVKHLKCPHCEYRTNLRWHLNRHLMTHSSIKHLKCPHCEYRTNLRGRLNQHLMTHSSIKHLKCSECDYRTNIKGRFNEHLRTHSSKNLKCPDCDYRTNIKQNLTSHLLVHSTVKNLKCTECSYKTNKKGHFNIHLLTHSKIKRFTCSECNYGTNRKGILRKHILTHSIVWPKGLETSTRTDKG